MQVLEAQPEARRVARPEAVLHLETSVQSTPHPRVSMGWGTASFLVHVLVIGAILVVPLLRDEPLPPAESAVRAFFVTPGAAPPPPPPPPPAAKAPRQVQKPPTDPKRFEAPVVEPNEIRPDEGLLGLSEPAGPSGVEGGVPGGVVGGVVGGIGEAPPEPQVYRVGGDIKEPRKIKNVSPDYPSKARNANIEGIVVLECLVNTAGRVAEVKVLRSIPGLDEAAIKAVKQWVYTPTLVGGAVVPVLLTVTVRFSLN